MTTTIEALDADRQLKAKHRAMWALGNYRLLAGSGGFGRVPAGGSVCPRARFVTFRSRVLRD